MAKVGRKLLDIDPAKVEALASLCFHPYEIASIFHVSTDSLLSEYASLIDNAYPEEKTFIRKRANRVIRCIEGEKDKNKFRYKVKKLLRHLGYQKESEKEDMMFTSLRSGLIDSFKQQGITVHALGRGALEFMLGYTIKKFIVHIEQLFKDGMTWENYGKWHIDHKKPKSWFKFRTAQDIQFLECWGLKNLQPKWARDNISKRNRYIG